jgi:hypothetical protein
VRRAKDITAELVTALRERIAIVTDEKSRQRAEQHMERLREVSERIIALSAKLPSPIDPQLKHYLDRCSYGKALEFLEGGDQSAA